ncbi:cytochrome P450 [Hypoxylon sp. FL1284]|nr:cytochrome P450 [Hypoxylon sp. FL1284]
MAFLIASFLAAISLVLICLRLLANWTKLSKVPGPTLAGCTDLWRAYQQYNGKLREKIMDLHVQHGPVVRYGVRSVSISDPEVITVVYGSRMGFITADSYKVLAGVQNGKPVTSLLSTADETRHGALRRSVAHAFTPAAVLDYEKWIDVTIEELLVVISKKKVFDLSSAILWFTVDAAARFAFGESLGCLQVEGDVGDSIQSVRDRFHHWGWWSSLPQLEKLLYRNPVTIRQKRTPTRMAEMVMAKLKERTGESNNNTGYTDLLQRFLEASKDHPQLDTPGITGMLMSSISGAGDTTASTVTAVMFHLMKNSLSLKKLEDELLQARLPAIPEFAQVSKLPYLNAVIKEGMRLFTVSTWPMERLVPAGGATIAGMFFAEGTTVGCLPLAVHHNIEVFGEDAHIYRPERWLISDRERLRQMEAVHMGFSRGRRNCMGQNIALLQMKKVIPALVMKFKLGLADSEASLEADYSAAVAYLKPLYVTFRPKQI